jgi:hypothetical protein
MHDTLRLLNQSGDNGFCDQYSTKGGKRSLKAHMCYALFVWSFLPPLCISRFFSTFSFFSLTMTLQTRRTTGLTPLAIVLPHPPLPRRSLSKSSLLSSGDPHTPRSCHSPSLSSLHAVYYQSSNRKSSDSWNSSNADEMEYEWSPDQVLFLSRVRVCASLRVALSLIPCPDS